MKKLLKGLVVLVLAFALVGAYVLFAGLSWWVTLHVIMGLDVGYWFGVGLSLIMFTVGDIIGNAGNGSPIERATEKWGI